MVEIDDFMTLGDAGQHVIRAVRCRRGSVEIGSRMSLRPDYGRTPARFEPTDDHVVIARTAADGDDDGHDIEHGANLCASGTSAWSIGERELSTTFTLAEDEVEYLVLGDTPLGRSESESLYEHTAEAWLRWSDASTYTGRWREAVERSALTLKLLTHEPSGGIIAAGTTSLPEVIGGERNWDYRYVWIRDAAFTVYAFIKLGHLAEANAFTAWLVERLETCDDRDESDDTPPLSPLYDLDGNADIEEVELDHWSGYANSSPVRIGNAASGQLQLDIYGELIDALYLADKYGDGVSIDTWRHISIIIGWLSRHWEEADDGMWEDAQRGAATHLVIAHVVGRGRTRHQDGPTARSTGAPRRMEHAP